MNKKSNNDHLSDNLADTEMDDTIEAQTNPTDADIDAMIEADVDAAIEAQTNPTDADIDAMIEAEVDRAIENYHSGAEEQLDGLSDATNTQSRIIKNISSKKSRGKIRTTFALSAEAHNIMQQIGEELGYSFREIFDESISLLSTLSKVKVIELAQKPGNRTRKTFVMESTTLDKISEYSSDYGVARDSIIEVSLLAFQKFLNKLIDHELELTSKIRPDVSALLSHCDDLSERASREFRDDDHPVVKSLGVIAVMVMNLEMSIDSFITNKTWGEE